MAEELNAKISVDTGEARQNIAALNSQMRVLESGFKASAAEVEDWQHDAGKLAERINVLNETMGLQEQKLQNMEAQYQAVASAQGSNSTAAQKLLTSINKEKEALNKNRTESKRLSGQLLEMEDAAGDAGDELDDLESSAEDAGDGLEKAGDGATKAKKGFSDFLADLSHITTIAGGVKDAISGIVDVVKDIGTAALQSATEFAQMCDDLLTQSANTGVEAPILQAMGYNAGLYDVEMTTWEAVFTAMNKSSTMDAIAAAGIPTMDEAGQYLDRISVMKRVLAEAQQIYTMQGDLAADNWLQGLGFRAGTITDLNTLFQVDDAGVSNLARYWAQVRQWQTQGYTTSEADLSIGGALQDALDQLTVTKTALENLIGAGIAELITPFVEELNAALGDLIQLWSEIRQDGVVTEEERTQLVDKAKETLSGVWDGLTAEGGVLSTAGAVIWDGVKTAWEAVAPWFTDTMKTVGGWIWDGVTEAIGSVDWLGLIGEGTVRGLIGLWNASIGQLPGMELDADTAMRTVNGQLGVEGLGDPLAGYSDIDWTGRQGAGRTESQFAPVEAAVVPAATAAVRDVIPGDDLLRVNQATQDDISSLLALIQAEGRANGTGTAAVSMPGYGTISVDASSTDSIMTDLGKWIKADELVPTGTEFAAALRKSLAGGTSGMVAAAGVAAGQMVAEMQRIFRGSTLTVGTVSASPSNVSTINIGSINAGGNASAGDISAALAAYNRRYGLGLGAE